jgi:hypothetical protein
MAFGLPSKEEMRDYLISQGVPPKRAEQAAADAAKSNAAQAARTEALSLAVGAAPVAGAAVKGVSNAARYARGLETTGSMISPSELAVIQAKYPGRFINPTTGHPQSVAGNVLTGKAEPAMGAVRDPFANLIRGAEEAPAAARSYLTQPRPVVNPDTGYQLQQIMPGGKFGPGLTEWTAGQRAARTAANGAPLVTAAAMAPSDSLQQRMLPNSAGMDRTEDADFYRSVGANTFRNSPALDRSEDENLYRSVGAARLPSSAGMDQTDYPMRSPAVAAAKREIPMPPSRELQAQARAEQPSDGIFSRIFSGKDYQSNSRPVTEDGTVNWGNPDSAADFFRADKARMAMEGKAGGGGVGGKPDKDAALHKALEIIHHMIRSR